MARGQVIGVVRDHRASARFRDVAKRDRALLEVPGLAAVPAAVGVVRDQVQVRLALLPLHAGVAGVDDQALRVVRLRGRGERVHAHERGLVPDRPHDDARMVVVLADHLARDRLARRGVDLPRVRMSVLGPHQQAQLVGQVVLEPRVGVVREPHEVDAQVLQVREVLAQLVVGHRGLAVLGLLVLADSAKQDGLAVQHEPAVSHAEVAEARALGERVDHAVAVPQLRMQRVEVGRPYVPQARRSQPALARGPRPPGPEARPAPAVRWRLPVRQRRPGARRSAACAPPPTRCAHARARRDRPRRPSRSTGSRTRPTTRGRAGRSARSASSRARPCGRSPRTCGRAACPHRRAANRPCPAGGC